MRPVRSRAAWSVAAIVAIGIAALAFRVYRLDGRSLWLDEILTSQPAHLNGPGAVITWSQAALNQMPLFYMFTWLLGPWGDSEVILRLPALIAGVLTVFAVYLLARRLIGDRAGLVAAVLTAVMPFMVWYSQEARNYTLLMLLTTLQMYFALSAITRGRAIDWGALAAVTVLNLYTHYLALTATAAVAVYIGLFVLSDLLRGAAVRVKVVVAGVLFLTALSAALVPWRATLRTIYHGAVGAVASDGLHNAARLGALLVATGVVALVGFLARRSRFLRARPAAARRLLLAAATGAVVALAYLPWLPTLRVFLGRPDQSLGQIHLAHAPNANDVVVLLNALGLSGLLLVALLLGLVAVGLGLFRGRAADSGLVLCWLAVPLLLFLLAARSAIVQIDPRYLSFLFPAAILVIAAGVDLAAEQLERIARRIGRRFAGRLRIGAAFATLVATTLLLAQVLPALASSYQVPKEDYRGAAEHIAATSPPGSVLLAVGAYSDWAVICFQYYLRELHSPVTVVDGLQVTSETAATLGSGDGAAWGVVIFPSSDQLGWIQRSGEIKTDYVDTTGIIHVIRPAASGLSPIQQARAVLQWETPLEPRLSASTKLLDFVTGQAQLGPNLVPEPAAATQGVSGWSMGPGVTVDGASVVMRPTATRSQESAAFTGQLTPEGDYAVGFDCRNDGFSGSQTVEAVPIDASGHALPTFPGASAYRCPHSGSWTRSYFAISPPADTAAIALILRAQGSGTAQFRALQLSLILDVT
jgi:4-amino-4-deoxy-L-arabinose transferase-like glycosyltransferase